MAKEKVLLAYSGGLDTSVRESSSVWSKRSYS